MDENEPEKVSKEFVCFWRALSGMKRGLEEWSLNRQIVAKQTDDSTSIHITCEKDLAKI